MKTKTLLASTILVLTTLLAPVAHAANTTAKTDFNITVENVFSIEFYTEAGKVLYSGSVPFTSVDPSKSLVYPDGRAENDGKSDVGVICRSNDGNTWYLKVTGASGGGLSSGNVKYYMAQPYNRNTNAQTDGSLAQATNWYSIPTTATTVYTSGAGDKSNLPFGTLATFSYALVPAGLDTGASYTLQVTYTLTTAP